MDPQSELSDAEEVIRIYKQLHKNPEIGLKQFITTAFIKEYISKIPEAQIIEPEQDTQLQTGLVVTIKSPVNSEQNKNNAFLFRCDIDALPFKEESGVDYCS